MILLLENPKLAKYIGFYCKKLDVLCDESYDCLPADR